MGHLLSESKRILNAIDDESVKHTISSIQNLLKQATENKLVENISNALQSVQSLGELAKVGITLASPLKFALYGVAGAQIGMAILNGINTFLTSKNDSYLKKIVELNTQLLVTNIGQLRLQSGLTLQINHIAQHLGVNNGVDQPLIEIENQEARNILKHTTPMNFDMLALMQRTKSLAEEMASHLYQSELQDEDITRLLDQVDANPNFNWQRTIAYVVFRDKTNKIKFDRENLSYSVAKNLYDEKIIDQIMREISQEFMNKGKNLYYSLINSLDDTPQLFSSIMCTIPQLPYLANLNNLGPMPSEVGLDFLHYYHTDPNNPQAKSAENDIIFKWDNLYRQQGSNPPPLTSAIRRVILLRAYLEYCSETAKYFFGYRHLVRESYNGVKDTLNGFSTMIIHPLNTIKDVVTLPYHLLSNNNDIRTHLVRAVRLHPMRFFSSFVISSATGYGITNGVRAISSSFFHTAEVVNKSAEFTRKSSLIRNAIGPTVRGSAMSTATSLGVQGVTTSEEVKEIKKTIENVINSADNENLIIQNTDRNPESIALSEDDFCNLESKLSDQNESKNPYLCIYDWYQSILDRNEDEEYKQQSHRQSF